MRLLRRMPLSRLVGLCVGLVVLGASATAIADTLASGPTPPPGSLAEAVHGALAAAPVGGVSAHITLTNRLIEAGSLEGPNNAGGPSSPSPLLAGGSGRLWISDNGKARLELQSEQGDTQIIYDSSTLSIYDAASDSLYRVKLPAVQASSSGASGEGTGASGSDAVPSVPKIEEALTKLAGHVKLSGAIPDDVAGQPAYAVRLSPARNGGLLGSAELAWDAVHGVPLKFAVYSTSSATSPVLELKATGIEFGPVAESTFQLEPPANVKVTEVNLAEAQPPSGTAGSPAGPEGHGEPVTEPAAVAAALPFTLADPAEVAGFARSQVRLVDVGGKPAALITYGEGLGGIKVIESQAQGSPSEAGAGGPGESFLGNLPRVSISGSSATELPTALGTILSFQRAGVSYVVAGSVTAATARVAADGL